MMYVLTPQQMRDADRAAIATSGEDALMRNAGRRIAQHARRIAPAGSRIVAFAGPGNNGGDGFAALAELASEYDCVVAADDSAHSSRARIAAQERAQKAGVNVVPLPGDADGAAALAGEGLAVDALFGTGARLPLPEKYRAITPALDAGERRVLAIDIPSGIDALTGAVGEGAVRATVTVTLAAAKPGLLLEPARENVGELWCVPIGIGEAILAAQRREYAALDARAFCELLPERPAESDKRSAGAPLVIAGSPQFPGAAVLCARGAARGGAGYVTVATPRSAAAALRMHLIEQVVVELDDEAPPAAVVEELLDLSKRNGAVAIGPGLGLDARTGEIVTSFLRANRLPVVADASALFHLSKHLDVLRDKRAVVTPHAGEFARLSGKGTVAPQARVERVREFAERTGITTLLKGSDTLIYDGTTMHVNPTGTSALATAGTGDVLTGIIATLLSQGLSPVDAARAGAYWHGLAARRALRERRAGVIAGDVAEALGPSLPHSTDASDYGVRIL
ncbi:MAG: NAD(P)H-hydrate dehydratase [Candidatus Eremiobacteraeota bacterium]|nr:NAD(P)H-hydrate dehydratase [Candidatus Eremiobacteraeota bacterium]MBV9700427.1 NAD(P)H-hydrate dehydratase [Candidatus Eremiobacteraeota bacterium]